MIRNLIQTEIEALSRPVQIKEFELLAKNPLPSPPTPQHKIYPHKLCKSGVLQMQSIKK